MFLECDDSYCGLPSKVQAACRWALKQGYDYIAKVDDDVILFPREFRDSNFQNYDFVGHTNNDHAAIKVPWGFCYILSKKAMEIMSVAQLPQNNNDEAWCAYTLSAHGILLHHESRYHLYRGRREDFITPTKRPLRAPKRPGCVPLGAPKDCIAYAIFLHWYGYHATPDEINIKEYYKLYRELTQ